MLKKNGQIIFLVLILILLGQKGLTLIMEPHITAWVFMRAVSQILLGTFLFYLAQQIHWAIPTSAKDVLKKSAIIFAVGVGVSYLFFVTNEAWLHVSVRLVLAGSMVLGYRYYVKRWPKTWGAWWGLFVEFVFVFLIAAQVYRLNRFTSFHEVNIVLLRMAEVRLFDLFAWSFVFIIAWFTRWLSEAGDDRKRILFYWMLVCVCCACTLSGLKMGIATILFCTALTGAFISWAEVQPGRKAFAFRWHLLGILGLLVLAGCTLYLCYPQSIVRLQGFIHSEANRFSTGYVYALIDRVFAHVNVLKSVPKEIMGSNGMPDEFKGYYLVALLARTGYMFVGLLVGISLTLCWLLFDCCSKVTHRGNRMLASVFSSAIVLQIVLGLLQNIAWIPFLHIQQPFSEIGITPFCINMVILGCLLRLFGKDGDSPCVMSIRPLISVPVMAIMIGLGLYTWRQSESRAYKKGIHEQQEIGRNHALDEADKMIAEVKAKNTLGEYGVVHVWDRDCPLASQLRVMVSTLSEIGRSEEATKKTEAMVDLVRRLSPGDSFALVQVLSVYADSLDRVCKFDESVVVYKELAEMRLRLVKQYDASFRTNVVLFSRSERINESNFCLGDIVLSFNEKPVFDAQQIENLISDCNRRKSRMIIHVLRNWFVYPIFYTDHVRFTNGFTAQEIKPGNIIMEQR